MVNLSRLTLAKAFPEPYREHAYNVANHITLKSPESHLLDYDDVLLNHQPIRIFNRIDLIESQTSTLYSDIEITMLDCLYTRNHDGYTRQRHMQRLLHTQYPEIALPYVMRLFGDYVLQIMLVIEPFVFKHQTLTTDFLTDNPIFWNTQKRRVISYWNEYYRHCYNSNLIDKNFYARLEDYPIWQLVLKIEQLLVLNNNHNDK